MVVIPSPYQQPLVAQSPTLTVYYVRQIPIIIHPLYLQLAIIHRNKSILTPSGTQSIPTSRAAVNSRCLAALVGKL